MHHFRILACLLTCFILAILIFPVFAVEYNVGVKPGDYVKYSYLSGPGDDYNLDWLKFEVTGISGKIVTVFATNSMKDGSDAGGNGTSSTWNIEAGGAGNGQYGQFQMIFASNLKPGDLIATSSTTKVNRTDTRSYLGVSRTVNVIEGTSTYSDDKTITVLIFIDKAIGVILETQTRNSIYGDTPTDSYIITETNIFEATTTPSPTSNPSPTVPEYPSTILIIAVIATATLLGTIVIRRKQSRKD